MSKFLYSMDPGHCINFCLFLYRMEAIGMAPYKSTTPCPNLYVTYNDKDQKGPFRPLPTMTGPATPCGGPAAPGAFNVWTRHLVLGLGQSCPTSYPNSPQRAARSTCQECPPPKWDLRVRIVTYYDLKMTKSDLKS